MIKILCVAIVLIPTLIAALVFYIARALFAAPEVLFGTAQPAVAVLCVIAGILLLLPLLTVIAAALYNWISTKAPHK